MPYECNMSNNPLLLQEIHEVGAGIGSLVLGTAQVTTGAEHQPDCLFVTKTNDDMKIENYNQNSCECQC